MRIEQLCVGFVICILVGAASALFSFLFQFMTDEDYEFAFVMAWLITSIGFGICLTYILYTKGLI